MVFRIRIWGMHIFEMHMSVFKRSGSFLPGTPSRLKKIIDPLLIRCIKKIITGQNGKLYDS